MWIFKTRVLSGGICIPQGKLRFQTGGKWVLAEYWVDASNRAKSQDSNKSHAFPGPAELGQGVAFQIIQNTNQSY